MSEAGVKSAAAVAATESGEPKPALSVVQSAGAQLSAARIQAGLSLAQVAEQLKLSQRQIQAIENNDFAQLPKMVIVRGFIRSYAKLLRIDAQAILASLPEEQVGTNLDSDLRPTLSTPFSESRTSFLGRSEQTNRKYLLGAGGLAIAALLFIGFQQIEHSSWFQSMFHAPALTANNEANAQAGSLPEQSQADQPLAGPAAASEAQALPLAAPPISEPVAASGNAQTVKSEPVAAPAPASGAAVAAPVSGQAQALTPAQQTATDAAEAYKLRLKFNVASWFQIKAADGKVLTAHVGKAGTEEVFDLRQPVRLRVGNATGVEVESRGQVQTLVPAKDSNVADLNLK